MKRVCMLAVLCSLALAAPAMAVEHTTDSIDTVKANIAEKKAVLIDVRERGEWEEGHLRDAMLVPLSQLQRGQTPDALPKDRIIYCHCRSGGRVLPAAEILREKGYDVRPLRQGFRALLQHGFAPAER